MSRLKSSTVTTHHNQVTFNSLGGGQIPQQLN
jgi:hypothetical protein